VTNPVFRHPALIASVMATLQIVPDGRMVLGCGVAIRPSPMPIGRCEQLLSLI
jgi:alkanesulfonate monooxygenase SsuD/methylene tetrahydromethanopterin reductase-like flavin-dependent oxidoreductase (luciferase family)